MVSSPSAATESVTACWEQLQRVGQHRPEPQGRCWPAPSHYQPERWQQGIAVSTQTLAGKCEQHREPARVNYNNGRQTNEWLTSFFSIFSTSAVRVTKVCRVVLSLASLKKVSLIEKNTTWYHSYSDLSHFIPALFNWWVTIPQWVMELFWLVRSFNAPPSIYFFQNK